MVEEIISSGPLIGLFVILVVVYSFANWKKFGVLEKSGLSIFTLSVLVALGPYFYSILMSDVEYRLLGLITLPIGAIGALIGVTCLVAGMVLKNKPRLS